MKLKLSPDAAPSTGTPVPDEIAIEAQKAIAALTPFAAMAGPDGEMAILAANAALGVYKLIVPYIEQLAAGGQISADQQAAVLAKYNDIADNVDARFSGPAWEVTAK